MMPSCLVKKNKNKTLKQANLNEKKDACAKILSFF